MGLEDDRQLVRRYFEEHARDKDVSIVDEVCAEDYVNQTAPEGFPADRDGAKQLYRMYNTAMPDWEVDVEDVVAEGDRVGLRWSIRGTHEGELMGVAPTGEKVHIGGIFLARVEDGEIIESWEQAETMTMMQQIGVAPAPQGAPSAPWQPRVDRPSVSDADPAETRAVYERFDKVAYQGGDLDELDGLVAEDFAHHASLPTPPGRDGYKQFLADFRSSFPDVTSTNHDMVVEGERALVRYTATGTHEGEFMGIPGTGTEVAVDGISIYRIVDGQVTDEWSVPDMMSLMEQLGVLDQG